MKPTRLLAAAAIGCAMVPTLMSCTTAEKQAQSSAYEACKAQPDADARQRCIDAEQDRVRQDRADRDDRCIASIEEQRLRAAMIDGRAAPTGETGPAGPC